MFLLKKLLLFLFAIGICFDKFFIYTLLLFTTHRIYQKSQSMSLVGFLQWLLKDENGFTLIYGFWVLYYQQYLFQVVPLIIYCILIWNDLSQEEIPSRNKQLKQDITLLKIRVQILILLYYMIACLGEIKLISKMITLGFILKLKYGFNSYLQLMFRLAHNTIYSLLENIPPLLKVYKWFYRIACLFGKVYTEKRIQNNDVNNNSI